MAGPSRDMPDCTSDCPDTANALSAAFNSHPAQTHLLSVLCHVENNQEALCCTQSGALLRSGLTLYGQTTLGTLKAQSTLRCGCPHLRSSSDCLPASRTASLVGAIAALQIHLLMSSAKEPASP